jgi:hypothetical protein
MPGPLDTKATEEPQMRSRIGPLARSLKTGLISLTAATGNHCPLSGTWVPQESPTGEKELTEGSLMPTFNGKSVIWTFVAP